MKFNKNDIIIDVIGDAGPFSLIGKSIGYKIKHFDSEYLIDCGAPVFQSLGFEGIKKLKGIIGTHSHDDHKRWFSDICLFMKYIPGINKKVNLLTSETIHEEFLKTSRAALEKSFTEDSKRIIEIPYSDFVNQIVLGPTANYKIIYERKKDTIKLCIKDKYGNNVSKDKAKILVNEKANRPRMLFYDEQYKEWVEPEIFYPFSDNDFYSKNKNIYVDDITGLKIEAIKSTAWHGVPTISVKISSGNNECFFSSDTCYNYDLWENLSETKYDTSKKTNTKKFRNNQIIYEHINDYIERIWSKERFSTAMKFYKTKSIIHDVSIYKSIVHTDYYNLHSINNNNNLILTHSPDNFTSIYPLFKSGKKYLIHNSEIYEIVDNKIYELNADVYHKIKGNYFVGYKSAKGKFYVMEDDKGILSIKTEKKPADNVLFKVNLFLDINGSYFKINDFNTIYNYIIRPDNKIEYVNYTNNTSYGKVKKSVRDKYAKYYLS